MKARVQKWGNSLAIRIPQSLGADSRLIQGAEVDIVTEYGRLVIPPSSNWSDRWDALLDQISIDNIHPETDFGPPLGNEFW